MLPGLQPWRILVRGLKSSLHFPPDGFTPRIQPLSPQVRMSETVPLMTSRETLRFARMFAMTSRETSRFARMFAMTSRETSRFARMFAMTSWETSRFARMFAMTSRETLRFARMFAMTSKETSRFARMFAMTSRGTSRFARMFAMTSRETSRFARMFAMTSSETSRFARMFAMTSKETSRFALPIQKLDGAGLQSASTSGRRRHNPTPPADPSRYANGAISHPFRYSRLSQRFASSRLVIRRFSASQSSFWPRQRTAMFPSKTTSESGPA